MASQAIARIDESFDDMNFLMAEDNPKDAELFTQMLEAASLGRYQITCVKTFSELLEELEQQQYSALILDLQLPDKSGLENIKYISRLHPELPVVILTGANEPETALQSLHLGAQDYLYKSEVNPGSFMRSLRYALERKQIQMELKHALQESAYQNIQLESMAKHDPLTKLPNRSFFYDIAETSLRRARRQHKALGLLYFDLNGFKNINDTYGHSAGDEVLKTVATRIKQAIRATDTLARLGGDEFVLLTDLLENGVQAYSVAQKVYLTLCEPMQIGFHRLNVSVSIGIATYPETDTLETLVRHADVAMYEAKQNQGHFACFYTPRLEASHQRIVELEKQIPYGLLHGEFSQVFQPIYDLTNGRIEGCELLCRWQSHLLGSVSADEFIPVAESTNLIEQITQQNLRAASQLVQELQELDRPALKLSLNICAKQLMRTEFSKGLLAAIDYLSLPRHQLCIEITERQIIENISVCRKQLSHLKSEGLQIALDDYGTGFSSITHLKSLPIDHLKIDRSLINQIDKNKENEALSAGIIEMSHRLNMNIIAEGVERDEERLKLKELGCDQVQGYLFCRPMDHAEFLTHVGQQVDVPRIFSA